MIARIALAALAGGLMFTASAFAGEAELNTIRTECAAQLGFSPAKCSCIAQKAGEQLNDTQQKFMVANLTKDEKTFTAMQSSMPMDQMVATGQFMSDVPDQCN